MDYTFDQIFAADPATPGNVASNASVVIFTPGDESKTPLALRKNDGSPMPNPVQTNAYGFAGVFIADIERVAWAGAEFSGFFTSYDGMAAESRLNRQASESAAASAELSAAMVGAPADSVTAALVGNPATLTGAALSATIGAQVVAALPTEKIVALGTSIAAAYGATSAATAYPARAQAQLATLLGETYAVIAAGVSGDTTGQMLTRLPALLDTHKPTFVTIEVSVNDARIDRTVTQQDTVANLRKIIAKVRLARATPVLITSTWFNPVTFGSASYDATSVIKAAGANVLAREISKELGVPLVDMYRIFPKDGSLLNDGLHPNDAGHNLWGLNIASIIAQESAPAVGRTVISDNFERADSTTTLGTAGTGQIWTAPKGTWGIQTGKAYAVTATEDDTALIEAAITDMTVEAVGSRQPQDGGNWMISLIARATDKDNLYLADVRLDGVANIYKKVAGVYTKLITVSGPALVGGDKLTFSVKGTQLILSLGGKYLAAVDDATYASGTKAGIRQSGTNPNRVNDFSVRTA